MAAQQQAEITTSLVTLATHKIRLVLPTSQHLGALAGPLVLGIIWFLSLTIPLEVQQALAIVSFMMIYWIFGIMDPGLTALIGCFLFWCLNIAPASLSWSGFTKVTPWYIFGALLMGQAASRTGLAQGIAARLLRVMGFSPSKMLLGLMVLVCGFNFFMPSAMAQTATLAPLLVGIITGLGARLEAILAKGSFWLYLLAPYYSIVCFSVAGLASWPKALWVNIRVTGSCGASGSSPTAHSSCQPYSRRGCCCAGYIHLSR
ncbi:hypothetical protein C2W62_40340 [Candidatus Entotheonella serta]|nr:hypothetical protein C2W62_40340 [Candidatus Entotheonella serta]